MDLLDIIASRENAINTVEANANLEWKEVAYVTGVEVATRQTTLISEDIWDNLPAGSRTHEPRAMGAVMRRLRKDKIIVPTEQFVISPSTLGHGRPSRVWKSLHN